VRRSGRLLRWLIAVAVSLLMALSVLLGRGTFQKTDPQQLWMDLSDAFLLPGAMLGGLGGLIFVAGRGFFDMVNFGVMKVLSLVRSEAYRAEQPKTFYDYIEAKSTSRRGGYAYLLVTGLACLALAGLFLVLYLNQ